MDVKCSRPHIGYNSTILGTCSLCGGPVSVPTAWWSIVPPTPMCQQCGAIPTPDYGPVIPMQPILPMQTSPWSDPDVTPGLMGWGGYELRRD